MVMKLILSCIFDKAFKMYGEEPVMIIAYKMGEKIMNTFS
jgi:hypothetical protein